MNANHLEEESRTLGTTPRSSYTGPLLVRPLKETETPSDRQNRGECAGGVTVLFVPFSRREQMRWSPDPLWCKSGYCELVPSRTARGTVLRRRGQGRQRSIDELLDHSFGFRGISPAESLRNLAREDGVEVGGLL